jgi:hypothetical protein
MRLSAEFDLVVLAAVEGRSLPKVSTARKRLPPVSIRLNELRGFASDNLRDAFKEAHGRSGGVVLLTSASSHSYTNFLDLNGQ